MFFGSKIKGLSAAFVVLLIALWTSDKLPGGLVLNSLLIGFVLGQIFKVPVALRAGLQYGEKFILSLAVALMGLGLSIDQITLIGWNSFWIILVSIFSAFLAAWFFGRKSALSSELITLSAVGNAICGSSAIAAAAPVIQAKEKDMGVSVALVNGMGSIWMFIFPLLLINTDWFDVHAASQFIGATLQAVGHVSGAGFAISEQVGQLATMVKLGRVILLGPLLLILSLAFGRWGQSRFPLPWFIVVFFVLMTLRSFFDLPVGLVDSVGLISKFLLAFAMACVGWRIQWADIKASGLSAVSLTLSISLTQIILVGAVIYWLNF